MQKSYWTHPKSPRVFVIVSLVLALGSVAAVEYLRLQPDESTARQKIEAARLAADCFAAIKEERLSRGIELDPINDPAESGLIGFASTPVTSNSGHLPAKQTSINPNFAAVVVEMLHQAGVKPGDTVAVGFSGSFPALNTCVCAALETMEAKPIVIASTTGSQWGANHPEFLWLDMQQTLNRKGLIHFEPIGATLGGQKDVAENLPRESRDLLIKGMKRTETDFLDPKGYYESLEKRIATYEDHAQSEPIAAYINVGGGSVSVGTHLSKKLFRPGLNQHLPEEILPVESVMGHFLEQDIPVLHFSQIETLALRYQLPVEPKTLPQVAIKNVQSLPGYNRWIAIAGLCLVSCSLYLPTRFSSR